MVSDPQSQAVLANHIYCWLLISVIPVVAADSIQKSWHYLKAADLVYEFIVSAMKSGSELYSYINNLSGMI